MAKDNEVLNSCPMYKCNCWKCKKIIYKKTPFIHKKNYCNECEEKELNKIWKKYGD